MKPVLTITHLSKTFHQRKKEPFFISSKQFFQQFFQGNNTTPHQALKDISFSLYKGEILGIIGSNGSGKSTLLRIIASIYSYQEGSITSKGKIRSMIGLETGLRRLLTVKNNIYLISSLFGLSLKEIKQSYQSILSFSELEEYEQYPFYQLSAGMKQKLAFSIAAHSKADILLLDEVFTFGDEAFREKSIAKLKQLVKKGMSIIFVSHELELIKKHADRVLWIDRGQLVKEGTPEETVQAYLKK